MHQWNSYKLHWCISNIGLLYDTVQSGYTRTLFDAYHSFCIFILSDVCSALDKNLIPLPNSDKKWTIIQLADLLAAWMSISMKGYALTLGFVSPKFKIYFTGFRACASSQRETSVNRGRQPVLQCFISVIFKGVTKCTYENVLLWSQKDLDWGEI